MDYPSTRSEARESGARFYVTGRSCPNGHNGPRYTSNGTCTECTKLQCRSQVESGYYSRRYAENSDEVLEKQRRRYRDNPEVRERALEYSLRWAKENPEKVRSTKKSYKARRRAQKSGGIGGADLAAWLNLQDKVCYWCGDRCDKNHHVDHYEPLSKGGEHEIDNLVISCPSCNLKKSSKDPYKYAQEHGRLF